MLVFQQGWVWTYEGNYALYIFPATFYQVVMSMEYFETAGLVQSEPNFTVRTPADDQYIQSVLVQEYKCIYSSYLSWSLAGSQVT
jgi:hypothetical protein